MTDRNCLRTTSVRLVPHIYFKMCAGPMVDQLDRTIKGRRSMEEALADLRVKYQQQPSFELARMIQQLEAEIAIRKRPPKRTPLHNPV